ncbi:cysteine desulfurase family protein [uncultured Pseudoflavonifractor sp.]|uniref:cysteine desulfurase family protein n=1 Tax=uncultured Pseudoflavonifractor sp. TaxID=1221379 RepID=UPI0025D3829E|nr:cysteine desulfurase family protein [uncultured Pseudoflavonifractor sp.]
MIYLDNAATTRVCPQAAQAALEAMTEQYGNPSSRYPLGREAARRLKEQRGQVAAALGCAPEEIFFTSCGTEGDNWAIRGAVELGRRKGKHIITTAFEHAAVLEPCKALEREGYEVTWLRPDRTGHISIEDLTAALRPDTVLVSMMLVNNELGTIQPVAEAARAIRAAGSPALLHTDAVQAFLKVPFTPKALGVDLLTISGHKVRAPKGVGALYIRRGLRFPPLMLGGGQEEGMRPGTEATAQTAAFAAACAVGKAEMNSYTVRMKELKEYALDSLLGAIPELKQVGEGEAPHILCLTLPGYKSEVLVRVLGDMGVCVSAGSACHRGRPSHVFAAMGLPKNEMDGAFRVSFSPDSTREDVDGLREALVKARDSLFTTLS